MEYKYLKPYRVPRDYFGRTWQGWYAVLGRSRDSEAIEESNYRTILADLRKFDTPLADSAIDPEDKDFCPGDSTVTDTRCNHWAVGWIETIYVHSSNVTACERAEEILANLTDYPIFDETDFSNEEDTRCEQIWRTCYNPQERVEYLRNHSYTAQSLADLLKAIRGGEWYYAANMLDCPSDILLFCNSKSPR